jgi:hypothetical protein
VSHARSSPERTLNYQNLDCLCDPPTSIGVRQLIHAPLPHPTSCPTPKRHVYPPSTHRRTSLRSEQVEGSIVRLKSTDGIWGAHTRPCIPLHYSILLLRYLVYAFTSQKRNGLGSPSPPPIGKSFRFPRIRPSSQKVKTQARRSWSLKTYPPRLLPFPPPLNIRPSSWEIRRAPSAPLTTHSTLPAHSLHRHHVHTTLGHACPPPRMPPKQEPKPEAVRTPQTPGPRTPLRGPSEVRGAQVSGSAHPPARAHPSHPGTPTWRAAHPHSLSFLSMARGPPAVGVFSQRS